MALSDNFRRGVLLVRSGPATGMRYEISASCIIIGRRTTGSNLDVPMLQIDDARISRSHLEILAQPDGLYVRDLGSANGSWLNGRPLGGVPVRLEDGAEILLGSDSLLQFRLS
jgi:pSer/pThr/pTyr-binding forkhead associated (FHA) protein